MQTADEPRVSSLERMLAILDLFTEARPVWEVEEIAAKFGYTRSTAYRYVRELADAGLLAQAERARYTVGPRIIELDRQLRVTDPLLLAMHAIEHELPRWSDARMWLLCRVYRDTVTCIYETGTLKRGVTSSRGVPMPLFRGATSKAILAFLPERHYTRLFLDNAERINEAGLGGSWNEYKASLRQIRHNGYAFSGGEVEDGVFGIAAPVFAAGRKVIGSIGVVPAASPHDRARRVAESKAVIDVGARLSRGTLERIGSASGTRVRTSA
jgi:DNA-binding IclR family transcriptional regulator